MSKADKVYHDLLKDISDNGIEKGDRTGTGTKSIFGRQIRFNMEDGFPMLTTKKLHIKSIIHELIWFLNGDTNIKYLNDNGVTIWDEWADENGDLGPIYGKQWVDWGGDMEPRKSTNKEQMDGHLEYCMTSGINQIQHAIERLQTHPDCRRILVTALNPGEASEMKLPPCHYGFQLWTSEMTQTEREIYYCELKGKSHPWFTNNMDMDSLDKLGCPRRKISLMWNQRSVDTFLGLPFNIASYALLLQMFAQQSNMVPDELIGNLGDTHLYSNHYDYVEKQLTRDTMKHKAPKLKLNKADDIFSYKYEDFEIVDYTCEPNFKNVPIAI